jgi:hypothetical protein
MCCFFSTKGTDSFCVYQKENDVFVWSAPTSSAATSFLVDHKDVLFLLDPRDADEGGAYYVTGQRMLIFAASNNNAHFTGDIGKVTGDYPRFLGPFTDDELEVSLPLMGCHDMKNAFERAKRVGNLPRYLIDDDLYHKRETLVTVSNGSLNMERIVAWSGMEEIQPTATTPGTLFSVSAMMDNEEDPDAIGYDGESGVDYGTLKFQVMSKEVWTRVVMKNRSSILSFWASSMTSSTDTHN